MKTSVTSYTHVASHEQSNPSRLPSFIALYDLYFARVYNYVCYRCYDADTADDLTAIIWEKALNNYYRYQPDRAPFLAWLLAIARNIVNEHLRSQNRHPPASLDALPEQPDHAALPETRMISLETTEELISALRTLEERDREITVTAVTLQCKHNGRHGKGGRCVCR